jgi:signal-transduction protein with cAMP-binding, CBS, and nucleotidyltransferase domain
VTQQIESIMTRDIEAVGRDATLEGVSRVMRDMNIGDVLVTDADGCICGIVTDRDIVVRAAAAGRSLASTTAGEICTKDIVQVEPTATVEETTQLMRERSVRRVVVVSDGCPVGIVTLGDLAQNRDPSSVLSQISAAAPNA